MWIFIDCNGNTGNMDYLFKLRCKHKSFTAITWIMHHPRGEGYFLETLEWMDPLPSNLNSYEARLGNKSTPGGNTQKENDKDTWKNKASIWEPQCVTL